MQRRAGVAIDPPDADEAAEGHQVALKDLTEITVTVTSADTSRTKVYRVRLGQEEAAGPAPEEAAGLAPDCLRGAVTVGFSLVVYEGGSMEDLVACAEGRSVTALYALAGGEYVSYIRGAPEFVNRSFAGLFADGVPVLKPLTVKSEGPATAAPRASAVTGPWAACLQGEIAEGFNLVVYEGGSVDDLVACAEGVGLAALYALNDGVWDLVHPRCPGLRESLLPGTVHRRPAGRHAARRQARLTSRDEVQPATSGRTALRRSWCSAPPSRGRAGTTRPALWASRCRAPRCLRVQGTHARGQPSACSG